MTHSLSRIPCHLSLLAGLGRAEGLADGIKRGVRPGGASPGYPPEAGHERLKRRAVAAISWAEGDAEPDGSVESDLAPGRRPEGSGSLGRRDIDCATTSSGWIAAPPAAGTAHERKLA